MVALGFDERRWSAVALLETIDHRVGTPVCAAAFLQHGQVVKGFLRGRQFIDNIAGLFTFSAADTPGGIMQHAKASGIALKVFVGSRRGMFTRYHGCSCGRTDPAEEFSSGYTDVSTSNPVLRLMDNIQLRTI